MLLGARLRRLRELSGVTREQARAAVGGSVRLIDLLELGRVRLSLSVVEDLLGLYGVTDEAVRAALLPLADPGAMSGWWRAYDDVVPDWLRDYLALEQAAGVIRTYEVQLVPGLLQTEAYARAIMRLGHEGAPPEEIERRVELRMRRQEILYRGGPPRLWAVLDEAVLRRPVGSPAVMRAQLTQLMELSARPNVKIQVLPFHVGGHPAIGGPVTVLRMPEPDLPDVVYLENLTGAGYPDTLEEIAFYWDVMNRLATMAEPPISTPSILDRIRTEG